MDGFVFLKQSKLRRKLCFLDLRIFLLHLVLFYIEFFLGLLVSEQLVKELLNIPLIL